MALTPTLPSLFPTGTSGVGGATGTSAGLTGLRGTIATPQGYNQLGGALPMAMRTDYDQTLGPSVNYQPGVPAGQQMARGVTSSSGPVNFVPENQTSQAATQPPPLSNAMTGLQGALTGSLSSTKSSTTSTGGGAPSTPADVAQGGGGGADVGGAASALGAALTLGASSGTNNGVDTSQPEPQYMGNVLRNGLGTRSYPQDSWVLAGLQRAY